MIQINCKATDFLELPQLTEFQGELKSRSAADVEKIIKSIKKHGFCFPFFVWQHDGINHVFDGHGRLMALKFLHSKGEEIPLLPVVYVNAKNEAEAKELLLKLNSNYGHMTQDSVIEFLDGIQIDFNDLQLPDGIMNFVTMEDVEDAEFPDLKSGDRETMSTMNFTLAASQVEIVKQALQKCEHTTSEENPNRNGNALTYICMEFLNGH